MPPRTQCLLIGPELLGELGMSVRQQRGAGGSCPSLKGKTVTTAAHEGALSPLHCGSPL